MQRYLFCICFNGSCYSGWQFQKNSTTIQEIVQNSIERIIKVKTSIVSCSRTDAGVHANKFYFHIDADLKISPEKLRFALNNILPADIAILSIKKVENNFHARYSVKMKEYIYKIYVSKDKDPFLKDFALHQKKSLDIEKMKLAARYFIGRRDFSSFCGSRSNVIDKLRNVYFIDIYLNGKFTIIKIVGDGFLYNMVRIIVGTLLNVSDGVYDPSYIKTIFEKKDRKYAGKTVKACGLYLNEVIYF